MKVEDVKAQIAKLQDFDFENIRVLKVAVLFVSNARELILKIRKNNISIAFLRLFI